MVQSLQQSATEVESKIIAACQRSGRKRNEVSVIAVTKYVSLERVKETVEIGYTHLGENRWQDAKSKWTFMQAEYKYLTWHFIGHLQTNKVKDIIGKFQMIHSLDRWALAEQIQKKASELGIITPCFVQVNISGEESKYGLSPKDFMPFVNQLRELTSIHVVGLMTMAPYEISAEMTRPIFRELRTLRDEANRLNVYHEHIPHLSMGMSNDFEIAIEEGATWVRLGSILVGREAE